MKRIKKESWKVNLSMVMHAFCKMCVHVRGPPLGSLTVRACGSEEGECWMERSRCGEMKFHEAPESMRTLEWVRLIDAWK